MKTISSKGGVLLFLLFITFVLNANPIQSWDHEFNPALLSTGPRKYFETGMSAKAALSNSYFTIQQLFPADGVLLLDFNAMMADLEDRDLEVAANLYFEEHTVMTILGLSLGQYGSLHGSVSTVIPNGIIEAVADGISLGETNEDTADVYARLFVKAGMYAGFRWKDWQFSTKAGAFAPIVYTDKDARFSYEVSNGSTGDITAAAEMSIPIYTMMNLSDPTDMNAEDIINSLGYNLDLGVVKMKNGKPHYGFSLTGLTVAPAKLPYTTTMSAGSSMTTTDLLEYEDGSEPWSTDSHLEETETLEKLYEVSLPLSAGGFYCLSGYPRFIDWIGKGEVTLDDGILLLGGGITAKGAVFPLSALSLSLGYDKFLWETSMEMRVNLRVIEIGVDVGLSNTHFVNLFSPRGVTAGLNIAVGW